MKTLVTSTKILTVIWIASLILVIVLSCMNQDDLAIQIWTNVSISLCAGALIPLIDTIIKYNMQLHDTYSKLFFAGSELYRHFLLLKIDTERTMVSVQFSSAYPENTMQQYRQLCKSITYFIKQMVTTIERTENLFDSYTPIKFSLKKNFSKKELSMAQIQNVFLTVKTNMITSIKMEKIAIQLEILHHENTLSEKKETETITTLHQHIHEILNAQKALGEHQQMLDECMEYFTATIKQIPRWDIKRTQIEKNMDIKR